jgi:hypothetical protein
MPAKAGIQYSPIHAIIHMNTNQSFADYWIIRLRG